MHWEIHFIQHSVWRFFIFSLLADATHKILPVSHFTYFPNFSDDKNMKIFLPSPPSSYSAGEIVRQHWTESSACPARHYIHYTAPTSPSQSLLLDNFDTDVKRWCTIFGRLEGLGSGAPAAKIFRSESIGSPRIKKWWPHAVNCVKKLILKKSTFLDTECLYKWPCLSVGRSVCLSVLKLKSLYKYYIYKWI